MELSFVPYETMLPPFATGTDAIVLIGHGAPATDCPPELIGELMQLQWQSGHHGCPHSGGPAHGRMAALEEQIRRWPRHPGNDPYKVGLEQVAEALRPFFPSAQIAIGYNEFCSPSVPEVIDEVIRQGARRIFVIPSMLTPGGLHAEHDIPQALDALRSAHPAITIDYVWPFRVQDIAALLAAHAQQVMEGRAAAQLPA